MSNILILGGGFAGLIAAEHLARQFNGSHKITLVAPNNEFTFYPGLVQFAFGHCSREDITFDLSAKLSDLGVHFIQGEMVRLDVERRKAVVAGEIFAGEISYDYLLLALGRRLATERIPGFFENAQHLLGVKAAAKFGQLVRDFHDGTIIVGACPGSRLPVPVCESAFALAKKFKEEMADGKVRIKVVFPESVEEAFGGAELHRQLDAAFKRHEINALYDVPIREISFNEIISATKHRIKCDLLMLIPPFRGNASLSDLGITDEEHFVRVDDFMRVPDLDGVYAAGDITSFPGPKLAHMAVRQAEVAAANLISEVRGEEPDKVYYHEIATIIDTEGPDSLYLHYGIWDDTMYRLRKGRFWGWAKQAHDASWRSRHEQ